MRPIDLSGKTFGRLTVLHRAGISDDRQALWMCRCECGEQKKVRGRPLRRGYTKSCGCLQREHSLRMIVRCNADDSAEFHGLCDTLVEQVTRFPVPARELFAAVRYIWGSVDERRLYRALRLMVNAGRISQTGRPYSNTSAYTRPPVPWASNLAACIAEAAATYAVLERGVRRAA